MSAPPSVREHLRREPLITIAAALLLFIHLWAITRALPRGLDHDEGEHLRAASWMASGRILYRDFAENHTPFLYQLLAPIAPAASDAVALRNYTISARAMSAIAGTSAVLCIAGIAIRVGGNAMAALPVLAALFAGGWTWLRAIADVRSEPYTLLLFWGGAFLVVCAPVPIRLRAVLSGLGIGLVACAGAWNPKWPLESGIIFGVFAMQWLDTARRSRRDALLSVVTAALPPAVALGVALQATTLREFVFYSYTFAAAISRWFPSSGPETASFGTASPFAFCPPWLHPAGVFVALAAMFIARRARTGWLFVLVPLALFAASAIEVRFLYSYPSLWPQYFVMWACTVALLYGVALSWLVRAFPKRAIQLLLVCAIVSLWILHEWRLMARPVDDRHWRLMAELNARLAPGEAAWVRPEVFPAAVPAGAYYWYAFADQVPFSLAYARTPRGAEFLPPLLDRDLPPCRILEAHQGGGQRDAVHVRFIDTRAVRNLPDSKQCLADLARRGLTRRVGRTPILEVQPASAAPSSAR